MKSKDYDKVNLGAVMMFGMLMLLTICFFVFYWSDSPLYKIVLFGMMPEPSKGDIGESIIATLLLLITFFIFLIGALLSIGILYCIKETIKALNIFLSNLTANLKNENKQKNEKTKETRPTTERNR